MKIYYTCVVSVDLENVKKILGRCKKEEDRVVYYAKSICLVLYLYIISCTIQILISNKLTEAEFFLHEF